MSKVTGFEVQDSQNGLMELSGDSLELVNGGFLPADWAGAVGGFATGAIIGGVRGGMIGGAVGFGLGAIAGAAYGLATNHH